MTSPKSRITYSAICRSNGVVRARMRATLGPQFPHKSRASTLFASSATPPPGRGNWDLTIERTNSLVALVRSLVLPVSRRDMRLGFVNWCRAQLAHGGLSFRTLVQYPQKSDGVFAVLSIPSPLLVATHAVERSSGVSACQTKQFPKTEKRFPRER